MVSELFYNKIKGLLPEQEFEAFLRETGREHWRALRVNPLKVTAEEADRLFAGLETVPWEPLGRYYWEGQLDYPPGKHPYHEAGLYYIQEPSAMAPVRALMREMEDGEEDFLRVLDLCAAPGGKTTQIGSLIGGKGFLVANEPVRSRAEILSRNVERMGLGNCMVLSELPEKLAPRFPEFFDRILVDAPCSGEGMFRKSEEARRDWSPDTVQMCAERQKGILEQASQMLAPGGRLVYSTCTFSPEEDEEVISDFLQKHPDFSLEKVSRGDGIYFSCNPVKLWPHRVRGEGHFLASLLREKDCPSGGKRFSGLGSREAGRGERRLFEDFSKSCLRLDALPEGVMILFGEQLYLVSGHAPDLKGLKCLRPGLHLGSISRGRFQPGHGLALYLSKGDVCRVRDLTVEQAEAYIQGLSCPAEDPEKGWVLMTVDGYSLGWGKSDGRIIKNHYPKGLRKVI
ncbi:MAG: RsmF rRNA methyltransferase first C-terminal domain-containing protein [Lachnospiraceae bacterium]|nr:RsmF rRNA methyltransferase first C-terminal domain-containing protein [Lachnospiraceae bacterium]